MPHIRVDDGQRLHYVECGHGDATVVLSHSYLADHRHFEAQIEALAPHYRVLAFDHRGHGKSDKPAHGYSMERIYADGVAFVDAMDCAPVHWVGLSTGGFVGMRIAFRRPELLSSLVLMDTDAGHEQAIPQIKYQALFVALRTLGFGPVLGAAMRAMFGRTFLRDPTRAAERERWRTRFSENDIIALVAFGKAIFGRDDVIDPLRRVTLPTLVVVGEEDQSTPPAKARRIAAAIAGARLEVIPRAGHLCTVEEPERVNRILLDFLSGLAG